MRPVIPKRELMRIIRRFMQDADRGISINLFAELVGVSDEHLRNVFIRGTANMDDVLQRRVSKAYEEWRDGNVAIMQNRDGTKFVTYRKNSKPRLKKSYGLSVVGGEIRVNVGMKNRSDYGYLTLDETLRGK